MKPRDQEDIDREAASFKLGYFGRFKTLLAYRLNEQKGSFVLNARDEVQIVSAEVRRGRVLVTVNDGGPARIFELKFELVEQF